MSVHPHGYPGSRPVRRAEAVAVAGSGLAGGRVVKNRGGGGRWTVREPRLQAPVRAPSSLRMSLPEYRSKRNIIKTFSTLTAASVGPF